MDTMQIVWIGLGVILVGMVFSACFVIKQQSIGIIERFGRFKGLALPGLNIRLPLIDRLVGHVNLRIQQLDVHVETKTKDNVFVGIQVSVQYQAIPSKIYEAFYKLESPEEQIQAFIFDVVRAKVPNIDLDDLFSKKDEIAIDVKTELHETMLTFGYEIIKTLVTDIQPNENVKHAMNEINTAQRMRLAAQEKAEAEKIMRVKQAEAEAEANILHGQGIAGQRQAIIEGLGHSVEELHKSSPKLKSESLMQMVLIIQYFDMLREIGSTGKSNTVFVNHSPSGVQDLAQQIREVMFAAESHKKD
jgi:regulator of protease activity HflC (stomatin/prohibitin superfamily)